MNNILAFTTQNLIPDVAYWIASGILSLVVLYGIYLMSKVDKAILGNKLSAIALALGIILTLLYKDILPVWILYPAMLVGTIIGLIWAKRVKMTEMPELVALLNGLGGAASAIVAAFAMLGIGSGTDAFSKITAAIAVAVGTITLLGSLVAAGKLHKVISQKPVVLPLHQLLTTLLLLLTLAAVVIFTLPKFIDYSVLILFLTVVVSSLFGIVFCIRVGGADMPITISLLNSLSGVAGAIAGLAIKDVLLVTIGGIVGASGLLLTQIMCRSINRKLMDILLGKTTTAASKKDTTVVKNDKPQETENRKEIDPVEVLKNAKSAIIVPGYGMAIAQAQHLVKQLRDKLVANGCTVKFAVHPVAGRMPGHMNVLLCEANVDYEDLFEMEDINNEFKNVDVTIVVGANDVMNPAAREAEGTPIYGMPILNVDQCKNVLIFNYDLKPGYAGVQNPLYSRKDGVCLILGNASETLEKIINRLN